MAFKWIACFLFLQKLDSFSPSLRSIRSMAAHNFGSVIALQLCKMFNFQIAFSGIAKKAHSAKPLPSNCTLEIDFDTVWSNSIQSSCENHWTLLNNKVKTWNWHSNHFNCPKTFFFVSLKIEQKSPNGDYTFNEFMSALILFASSWNVPNMAVAGSNVVLR